MRRKKKGGGGKPIGMIDTTGRTNAKRKMNKSIVHKEKHEQMTWTGTDGGGITTKLKIQKQTPTMTELSTGSRFEFQSMKYTISALEAPQIRPHSFSADHCAGVHQINSQSDLIRIVNLYRPFPRTCYWRKGAKQWDSKIGISHKSLVKFCVNPSLSSTIDGKFWSRSASEITTFLTG
jgi:hypothetical protein